MRVAGAWSVDPTSLEEQPADEPLTLARFPVPPHRPTPTLKAVEVTDLIHVQMQRR